MCAELVDRARCAPVANVLIADERRLTRIDTTGAGQAIAVRGGVVVVVYLVVVPDSTRVLVPRRGFMVSPMAVQVFADGQDTPTR
jgi:hypothetical protein